MDEGVFQHMTERAMSDVVQQDGGLNSLCLAVEDEMSFQLQGLDSLAHQIEGTKGVLEACVLCPRIDDVCPSQLLDAAETVEGWVTNDVEHETSWHTDEAKHRVVDDLGGLHIIVVNSII